MNARISVTVFAALGLSILIFISIQMFYTMNYDPFNKWFQLAHTKNLDNESRIFLIGSSQVGALNVTYIQNYLTENGKNYQVYDLGIDGDNPSKRINSIDKIISLHPDVVVYGLGFSDFERKSSSDGLTSSILQIEKPQSLWPSASILFDHITLPIVKFFHSYSGRTESPLIVTQSLIDNLLKLHQKSYDVYSKTPFIVHTSVNAIIRNQSEIKGDFAKSSSLVFNGVVDNSDENVASFRKIVDDLQKNNIKVIIYTVPYPKVYLDTISNTDKNSFNLLLQNVSESYNVKVYGLQEKYTNSEIWQDLLHVAINKKSLIYSDDLGKILLSEVK